MLAAVTGVALYLFRRSRGTIITAMVAHGIWDISTFLSAANISLASLVINLVLVLVGLGLGIAGLVSIWRNDQDLVVTSPTEAAGA